MYRCTMCCAVYCVSFSISIHIPIPSHSMNVSLTHSLIQRECECVYFLQIDNYSDLETCLSILNHLKPVQYVLWICSVLELKSNLYRSIQTSISHVTLFHFVLWNFINEMQQKNDLMEWNLLFDLIKCDENMTSISGKLKLIKYLTSSHESTV